MNVTQKHKKELFLYILDILGIVIISWWFSTNKIDIYNFIFLLSILHFIIEIELNNKNFQYVITTLILKISIGGTLALLFYSFTATAGMRIEWSSITTNPLIKFATLTIGLFIFDIKKIYSYFKKRKKTNKKIEFKESHGIFNIIDHIILIIPIIFYAITYVNIIYPSIFAIKNYADIAIYSRQLETGYAPYASTSILFFYFSYTVREITGINDLSIFQLLQFMFRLVQGIGMYLLCMKVTKNKFASALGAYTYLLVPILAVYFLQRFKVNMGLALYPFLLYFFICYLQNITTPSKKYTYFLVTMLLAFVIIFTQLILALSLIILFFAWSIFNIYLKKTVSWHEVSLMIPYMIMNIVLYILYKNKPLEEVIISARSAYFRIDLFSEFGTAILFIIMLVIIWSTYKNNMNLRLSERVVLFILMMSPVIIMTLPMDNILMFAFFAVIGFPIIVYITSHENLCSANESDIFIVLIFILGLIAYYLQYIGIFITPQVGVFLLVVITPVLLSLGVRQIIDEKLLCKKELVLFSVAFILFISILCWKSIYGYFVPWYFGRVVQNTTSFELWSTFSTLIFLNCILFYIIKTSRRTT